MIWSGAESSHLKHFSTNSSCGWLVEAEAQIQFWLKLYPQTFCISWNFSTSQTSTSRSIRCHLFGEHNDQQDWLLIFVLFHVPFARVSTVPFGTFCWICTLANSFISACPQLNFFTPYAGTFISHLFKYVKSTWWFWNVKFLSFFLIF